MNRVFGCELPDHLSYHIEHNVWLRSMENGDVIIGMTSYALALSGQLVCFTPKKINKHVKKDKSCGTVESGKWVGPVKSPVAGEIVDVNPLVVDDPGLINNDPYGRGWLVRLQPDDWSQDSHSLLSGPAAREAFQQKMDEDGFDGCS